ncbi:VCBS repeat-containing protein [Micromonospora globbae]|uniref:VCBS repeat-containing protein n=1 Tax=Micromonospora globbae TaxID=1894969 RepID=A0ABZ1SCA4_9ACTN|nr:VCBS repeat-containing protein [Micromonospora globbae]
MRIRTILVPSLAAILLAAATPTAAAAATASFGPRVDLPAGYGPIFVTHGDLDRDGRPDMAVANELGGTVSVLLNRGADGFRTMAEVGTGSRPMSVAIADVNGDGRADLVTANLGGTVATALGRGDGRFRAPQHIDLGGSSNPWAVVAEDLDGDHDVDVAVSLTGRSQVQVLLNDGRGRLTLGQTVSLEYSDFEGLRAADLNGDGLVDLVGSENFAGRVGILLGTGGGAFGPLQRIELINDTSRVVVDDYNSDGRPDIVAARGSSYADSGWLLLGNGDGTFAEPRTIPVRWAETVAGGDFDGDGRADLAFATSSVVFVLLGNGDGTFGESLELPVLGRPGVPTAADFTGDGRDDLAVPNGDGYPGTVWFFPTA